MNPERTLYLLTVRGAIKPSTIDAARVLHNETAGAPQSIAAARSLGDLSHMIYVPYDGKKNEILFLDIWNSAEGLKTFFANKAVQEQGGQMFAERDAQVWVPAEGAHRFALAAPSNKTDRYVGTLRGVAKSFDQVRELLDGMYTSAINDARKLGLLSHDLYVKMTPPGEKASLEVFGVDVWYDGEGMTKFYGQAGEKMLADVFAAKPDANIWKHPAGNWSEW